MSRVAILGSSGSRDSTSGGRDEHQHDDQDGDQHRYRGGYPQRAVGGEGYPRRRRKEVEGANDDGEPDRPPLERPQPGGASGGSA